jgi:hypothetical protein
MRVLHNDCAGSEPDVTDLLAASGLIGIPIRIPASRHPRLSPASRPALQLVRVWVRQV